MKRMIFAITENRTVLVETVVKLCLQETEIKPECGRRKRRKGVRRRGGSN